MAAWGLGILNMMRGWVSNEGLCGFAYPSSDPLSFPRVKFIREIKCKTKCLMWQESAAGFFSYLPSSDTSILNWIGHRNGLMEPVNYLKLQLGHRAFSIDTCSQPSEDQPAPGKVPLVWLTPKLWRVPGIDSTSVSKILAMMRPISYF